MERCSVGFHFIQIFIFVFITLIPQYFAMFCTDWFNIFTLLLYSIQYIIFLVSCLFHPHIYFCFVVFIHISVVKQFMMIKIHNYGRVKNGCCYCSMYSPNSSLLETSFSVTNNTSTMLTIKCISTFYQWIN